VKGIRLDMRIMPTEKQGFKAAAALAGLELSGWIRERLRLAARRELESAGQAVPFLRRYPSGERHATLNELNWSCVSGAVAWFAALQA
jgi:hypothetical protein